MKRIAIVALFAFAALAPAQTDNTVYVKQFKGQDVGSKVAAAQGTCSTVVPCFLVIDPSLAVWPAGSMPTLCANCYLMDYRSGVPGGVTGVTSDGKTPPGIKVTGTTKAGATALIGDGAGPVNVKAMGARGDGGTTPTDDTSALLAAQAKAIALGVPVYLPGGNYVISSGFTLSSGESWIFDGGASLVVNNPSGITVFNCGASGAGHSSISIQGARITANGANQYTYTGLAGSCINSHIQIKAYYPNIGMALNFAEENIFDFVVFNGATAGVQFANQSNANILSAVNVVGTNVTGSIGVSFDASSSANQFAASEITAWGVGLSNSGMANTVNGEWLEHNTVNVQALAGTLTLCGSNQGVMNISDGAIVNGGYGCSSPNQPNHRANAKSLTAYYPMNEGTGSTLYDWSGNGNNATLLGTPSWTTGPYGSALTLPNSTANTNKISIPVGAISYTAPFTVALLMRQTAGTVNLSNEIFRLQDSAAHWVTFGGRAPYGQVGVGYSSTAYHNALTDQFSTGRWFWVVLSIDPVANTVQGLNPVFPDVQFTMGTAWPLSASPASLLIENYGSAANSFTFGSIAIWQRALNIEEVKAWIEQESIYSAAVRPAPFPNVVSGGASKATCWKTTATIGYCSTVPDTTGSCTCN